MEEKIIASKPLVSIIVPVYNVQLYLAKCLDSWFLQPIKNIINYVLVDDEPDESLSICQQYAAKIRRYTSLHKKMLVLRLLD